MTEKIFILCVLSLSSLFSHVLHALSHTTLNAVFQNGNREILHSMPLAPMTGGTQNVQNKISYSLTVKRGWDAWIHSNKLFFWIHCMWLSKESRNSWQVISFFLFYVSKTSAGWPQTSLNILIGVVQYLPGAASRGCQSTLSEAEMLRLLKKNHSVLLISLSDISQRKTNSL